MEHASVDDTPIINILLIAALFVRFCDFLQGKFTETS